MQRIRVLSFNVNGLRAVLVRLRVTLLQFLNGLGAGEALGASQGAIAAALLPPSTNKIPLFLRCLQTLCACKRQSCDAATSVSTWQSSTGGKLPPLPMQCCNSLPVAVEHPALACMLLLQGCLLCMRTVYDRLQRHRHIRPHSHRTPICCGRRLHGLCSAGSGCRSSRCAAVASCCCCCCCSARLSSSELLRNVPQQPAIH